MTTITLQKLISQITKRLSDRKWRFILLFMIIPISLFLFLSITSNPLQYYLNNLKLNSSLFFNNNKNNNNRNNRLSANNSTDPLLSELRRSRIAVCLVGGARRFELTGPSIIEKVLEEYPNADLYLNSPLDLNSYKFSLLKSAPRIAEIRIFKPEKIPESDAAVRVLTASNSPNGIQGLLQYFNLVEGCLTMIKSYQQQNNFTYHWIIRTRVDGYWSTRLKHDMFIPGHYVVPSGSSYGGLNDRFGIGDFNTSITALSRLSMIQELDTAKLHELNSESSFLSQLRIRNVSYVTKRVPFCVVSDRTYDFPPGKFGVPVAAMSSNGPLSGAKCRPCKSSFSSKWAEGVVNGLDRQWSWTESRNGTMQLCDGHKEWEKGWQDVFDKAVGKKLVVERKRVEKLKFDECVKDFQVMKRRSAVWDVPSLEEVCQPLR
uniref:uncharacterized protein LOC122605856 n=1 Tax=Erigeron canadensis TaxID=72917 RepID=UPI001CB987F7|nr:uncharacterized protein LOC122605856 [Erigeron canadensis]